MKKSGCRSGRFCGGVYFTQVGVEAVVCLCPCTCRHVCIFLCMRHFLKIKKLLTIVTSEEKLGLLLFV